MILPPSRLSPRVIIFLVTVACLLPFFGIARYGLMDLDEGFYATVVWEMISRGDWLLPTYGGEPWLEKPIWTYWVAGVTYSLFGGELGMRLHSVVATLIMAFLIGRFVSRRFELDRGMLTAVAYCGSLVVVAIGRMMMTDAWLVLGLCGALIYWFDGLSEKQYENFIKAGVLLGIAMLAKGPVAIALFIGVAFLYRLWSKEQLGMKFGPVALLLAAYVGVTATWYLPAYQSFPEVFVQKFLIEQNWERFTGGDTAHGVPIWAHPIYYPAVLLLAGVPWVLVGLKKIRSLTMDPATRFLWCWLIVVVLFFTISGSKLPHYILPAMAPAMALLVVNARKRFEFDRLLVLGFAWSLIVSVLAQSAFQYQWSQVMAAPQQLAIESRPIGGRFVAYRLGRQTEEVTIGLTLEQTSHPSLGFYSQSTMLNAPDIETVIAEPTGLRLLARGELTAEDAMALAANGIQAVEIARIDVDGEYSSEGRTGSDPAWVLYRLDRA